MAGRVQKLSREGVGALGNHLQLGGPSFGGGGQKKGRDTVLSASSADVVPIFGRDEWELDDDEFARQFQIERARIDAEQDLENRLERDEMPVLWDGEEAARLGLVGTATSKQIVRVLGYGHLPAGEEILSAKAGEKERMPAWGMVWSPPKTVSLLLASPDSAVRAVLQEVLDQAADRYFQTLIDGLSVRRGKAGIRSEGIRGLLAVRARHHSSSAGDPHAHYHWIVSASSPSVIDGQWRALDGRVLLQQKKLAEAAANAHVKSVLSARLNLGEDAWSLVETGAAPAWDLAALQQSVATFSRARLDLQAVARRVGIDFSERTAREDAALWRKYREERGKLGEVLEHSLDMILQRDSESADKLRAAWRGLMGSSERRFLEMLAPVSSPAAKTESAPAWETLPQPDLLPVIQSLEVEIEKRAGREAAARARLSQRSAEHWQAELDALLEPSRFDRIQAAFRPSIRARIKQYEARRSDLLDRIKQAEADQLYLAGCQKLHDQLVSLQAEQVLLHEVQDAADQLLRSLTKSLGTFVPSDVSARLIALGTPVEEAPAAASHLLRYWIDTGQLQTREGWDAEKAIRLLANGGKTSVTADLHALDAKAALIPDALVKAEIQIMAQAHSLSSEQRWPLFVPLPKSASPEQAAVIRSVAQGRALTVTSGVAGAGKSYLAKPISDAACRQGYTVKVLSRNKQLGVDLALDLDLGRDAAVTLASFADLSPRAGDTVFWILDEAGLVDQADMQQVLDALASHPQWRLWALGDRLQAQAIDRRGTFGAVLAGCVPEARTQLTQSYRCAAWAAEHDLLRSGNPAILRVVDDGRLLESSDPIEDMAQQVLAAERLGDQAIALCATNATAAEVAETVQVLRKISVDDRTALRWGQKAGIGDRVRTRVNNRRKGITNGQVWTVAEIGNDGSLLLERPGRRVWVDTQYAREGLELAYAGTVDSAQGITVDRAIVDLRNMGRSLLYSAATRGRQAPVYVQSGEATLAAALARDDVTPTMVELIDPRLCKISEMTAQIRDRKPLPLSPEQRKGETQEILQSLGLKGDITNGIYTDIIDVGRALKAEIATLTRELDAWTKQCRNHFCIENTPRWKAALESIRERLRSPLPLSYEQLEKQTQEMLQGAGLTRTRLTNTISTGISDIDIDLRAEIATLAKEIDDWKARCNKLWLAEKSDQFRAAIEGVRREIRTPLPLSSGQTEKRIKELLRSAGLIRDKKNVISTWIPYIDSILKSEMEALTRELTDWIRRSDALFHKSEAWRKVLDALQEKIRTPLPLSSAQAEKQTKEMLQGAGLLRDETNTLSTGLPDVDLALQKELGALAKGLDDWAKQCSRLLDAEVKAQAQKRQKALESVRKLIATVESLPIEPIQRWKAAMKMDDLARSILDQDQHSYLDTADLENWQKAKSRWIEACQKALKEKETAEREAADRAKEEARRRAQQQQREAAAALESVRGKIGNPQPLSSEEIDSTVQKILQSVGFKRDWANRISTGIPDLDQAMQAEIGGLTQELDSWAKQCSKLFEEEQRAKEAERQRKERIAQARERRHEQRDEFEIRELWGSRRLKKWLATIREKRINSVVDALTRVTQDVVKRGWQDPQHPETLQYTGVRWVNGSLHIPDDLRDVGPVQEAAQKFLTAMAQQERVKQEEERQARDAAEQHASQPEPQREAENRPTPTSGPSFGGYYVPPKRKPPRP